jgi:hypothetical protein
MLAKWQAIPEPIIPDPITATFLIVRFIRCFYLFLLEYAFYLFTVKKYLHICYYYLMVAFIDRLFYSSKALSFLFFRYLKIFSRQSIH